VSNVFLGEEAVVQVHDGYVLVVLPTSEKEDDINATR